MATVRVLFNQILLITTQNVQSYRINVKAVKLFAQILRFMYIQKSILYLGELARF